MIRTIFENECGWTSPIGQWNLWLRLKDPAVNSDKYYMFSKKGPTVLVSWGRMIGVLPQKSQKTSVGVEKAMSLYREKLKKGYGFYALQIPQFRKEHPLVNKAVYVDLSPLDVAVAFDQDNNVLFHLPKEMPYVAGLPLICMASWL